MKRVLIVDDNATVRRYHRQLLESRGFAVEEAVNGIEGLEKALCRPCDLVLVDINMPKMDGYTMLARFRQEPALVDIPALVVTVEGEPRDETRAYAGGANLYLAKPVRPEEFLCYVRLLSGGP